MMKTIVLPLIALASAAPFEPKTYTFEADGEKATFNLVNETECLITIKGEEKKTTYTLVNNLLTFENKEEGTFVTFLVQESTEVLSLIDYDFFADKTYTIGETTLVLTTETTCTINGESATYVIKGDKIKVVSATDIYRFKFDENGALQVEEWFNWEEWLNKFLEPQTITLITTAIGGISVIIGLVANLKKMAREKQLSLESVQTTLRETLGEEIYEKVSGELAPYLSNVKTLIEKSTEVLSVLSKVLVLNQENTPQSKLAILKCIEDLGNIDNKVVEETKESIQKQETKKIEEKEEAMKKIDKIIEDGTTI